ncbi:MAG: flavin-containing monooxygenase [Lacipirellulaceae bacterium]
MLADPATTDLALPPALHTSPKRGGRAFAEREGGPADDRGDRVCVLGAGTSGLAMARRLSQRGVPFDVLEREPDLGGNWNISLETSSVCHSTHLISSKKLTEYLDHPMPDEWPEYPSHRQALEYLRGYATKHRLVERIEFGAEVLGVTPLESERVVGDRGWVVELAGGQRRRYRGVCVASGHNWDPHWPRFEGEFSGLLVHAHEYKSPELLSGKRVLVIGGGNSGCDLAVESAQHAAVTRLSLRRGYHFLPKFFHGAPIDACGERLLRWGVPLSLRRLLAKGMAFLLLGTRAGTGLPKPDHLLFQTHPTINSQLVYALRHGDLAIRPDVARLDGDRVWFTDGAVEGFDVVLCATGYNLTLPFLGDEHLPWRAEPSATVRTGLALNVFPPAREGLSFIGLIQPDSGQWGLADRQARLVAGYLAAAEVAPAAARRFRSQWTALARRRGKIRYLDTPRHLLEVEHYSYGRQLDRHYRRLDRAIGRGVTSIRPASINRG